MRYGLIKLIIAYLCSCSVSIATEFYVNPIGNDLWSGKIKQPNAQLSDGPFKTLERAKLAIRTLKQTNALNDKTTVNIAAGQYYLNQTLRFDSQDSGALGKEILWRGDFGAKVVISGGIPINCNRLNDKLWDCPVTKQPVNRVFFDIERIKGNIPKFELFVNDQKLTLARWPNQGWAHIKKPFNQTTQFSALEQLPIFQGDISNGQVHIFPGSDWYDQYAGVASISPSNNTVTLSSETDYPLQSGRRFYIRNIMSALDIPGEWMYDWRNRKILLIPPAGITPTQIILSSLPNTIYLSNSQYLQFSNLTFQHSAATAIVIKNSSNIVLNRLNVNNTGARGVEIINGHNVALNNSAIHHTGADGIDVSGGDRITLEASGHVIDNNHVHHVGTLLLNYAPAIDVAGVGAKVSHNLLEQGPGMGLEITGNDHLVEKNELSNFCLQASDCGAVYSGRDWTFHGNVIRNNYIHDIIGYGLVNIDPVNNTVNYRSPADARGVYLDDAASGFEVNGNIFENIGSIAVNIGGGRDNTIINNYIKSNNYAILVDDRWPGYDWSINLARLNAMPYKSAVWQSKYPKLAAPMRNYKWPEGNHIERNVIVTSKQDGRSLRYQVPFDSTVITDNLIWSTTNRIAVDYKVLELQKNVSGAAWSQWLAEGIEVNAVIADPCITLQNKQLTSCSGSPLGSIGFKPLPADIGLIR